MGRLIQWQILSKKVNKWRSTTWWYSLKWGWHNRGNVWDKIATRWAGKENWMEAGTKTYTMEDKDKFVTFVLSKMKLPTEQRKSKNKVFSLALVHFESVHRQTLSAARQWSGCRPSGGAKEGGSRRDVLGICSRRCNWKACRTKLRQCRA